MRTKWLAALTGAALSLAAAQASAVMVVTPTTDAETLISNILGGGITVSAGTEVYLGAQTQSGTFTGGESAGLGFDSGIILTSGDALLAPGPNSGDGLGGGASASNALPGDSQLDALIPESTNDAAVLQFDFTTTGGDLFFTFQFASEEYNEFVNSEFNDVFALFVNDVNVAIAPSGDPVSINNVNCGNPFAGAGPNCASYNNNDLQDGGPFFDIEYDGFTDAFVAQALGLGAGTHTMKFAIADAGDFILDSAVFIQAGSFTDTPPDSTPVPEPGTLALVGFGLLALGLARRRIAR